MVCLYSCRPSRDVRDKQHGLAAKINAVLQPGGCIYFNCHSGDVDCCGCRERLVTRYIATGVVLLFPISLSQSTLRKVRATLLTVPSHAVSDEYTGTHPRSIFSHQARYLLCDRRNVIHDKNTPLSISAPVLIRVWQILSIHFRYLPVSHVVRN
jgi:hypothetical protein